MEIDVRVIAATNKDLVKEIEKDVRIVMEEMTDSGKKALDSLPGKKKLQRTLENRMASLPKQFNMPTRKSGSPGGIPFHLTPHPLG